MQINSEQQVSAQASFPPNEIAKCGFVEVFERGLPIKVPSLSLMGKTVVVNGKWLKIATVMDSELVEGNVVDDPETFIGILKGSKVRIDLFAFPQNFPDTIPRHGYHTELDNAAVVSTVDYTDWWEKKIPQEARKNVRRALKRGVDVRVVPYDDNLVAGIKTIYDETPIRQGRRFWHYQKTLEQVKKENG